MDRITSSASANLSFNFKVSKICQTTQNVNSNLSSIEQIGKFFVTNIRFLILCLDKKIASHKSFQETKNCLSRKYSISAVFLRVRTESTIAIKKKLAIVNRLYTHISLHCFVIYGTHINYVIMIKRTFIAFMIWFKFLFFLPVTVLTDAVMKYKPYKAPSFNFVYFLTIAFDCIRR